MIVAGRRDGGTAGESAGGDIPPSRHPAIPPEGRLLGVDWGERRIGLALSDPAQRVAHPLDTITRRAGRRFPLGRLRPLLEQHDPVGVVMGLPLESDGSEGAAATAARAAGELIADKSGLPVDYVDERMTTARALQAVRDMGAGSGRKRRGQVDRLAAVVLLQVYLDMARP